MRRVRRASAQLGCEKKRVESCTLHTAEVTALHSGPVSHTTTGSAQFCLLCRQPEPVPGTSTARVPQLTPWDPCRLPTWSGRTIYMRYKTSYAPVHSITHALFGGQENGYSQQKLRGRPLVGHDHGGQPHGAPILPCRHVSDRLLLEVRRISLWYEEPLL